MSKKTTKKTSKKAAIAAAPKKTRAIKTAAAVTTAAAEETEATAPHPEAAADSATVAREMPAPGTVIHKRDRHGAIRCSCTIVERGVRYGRTVYKSLSAAAMAAARDLELTNKTQNGWTFWGLTKPPRPAKDPLEALQHGWRRFQGKIGPALKLGVTDANRPKLLALLDKYREQLGDLHSEVA